MQKANNKIVKHSISEVKRLHSLMFYHKDKKYLTKIQKLNREICLVTADFKCQRKGCLSSDNLQLHHLITRQARPYMGIWRYLSARYYWSSCIILCSNCHREYHILMGKDIGEKRKSIIADTINRIKEKYFIYQNGK